MPIRGPRTLLIDLVNDFLPLNRRTHPPCVPALPGGHLQPRLQAAPVALAVRGLMAVLALGAHTLGHAQSGDGDEAPRPAVSLRSSGMLLETLPEDAKQQAPTFVSGERIDRKSVV